MFCKKTQDVKKKTKKSFTGKSRGWLFGWGLTALVTQFTSYRALKVKKKSREN